jgi:hypothetical protein
MSFRVKVLAGPDQGRIFLLPPSGSLTVGRGEVDVGLADPEVSRNHFRISAAGSQVRLVDLGSCSGTRVNNEPAIGEQMLRPGDIIVVGETYLQLLADPEPATRAAPSRLTQAQGKPAAASTMLRRPDKPPSGETMPQAATHSSTSVTKRAATESAAVAELANTQFGMFALGSVLGVGKKGVVFRAVDTRDRFKVALKVFIPRFSRDEECLKHLARVIKTIHPLEHINLIDVYGAGRTEGSCWLSAELIEGGSVAELVDLARAGQRDWHSALHVAVDVADALMYLHGEQVLHRNLTPKNLLFRQADGTVKVGDVLTVKKQGASAVDAAEINLFGDVRYLAPERTWGDPSVGDHRSDLYSLGAVLYALLTGKPPIEGDTLVDTVHKIRTTPPKGVRGVDPTVPPALEAIVLRLLNKDPEDRFPDATDLLQHLLALEHLAETAEEGRTWRRRKGRTRSGGRPGWLGQTRGAGMNGPTWMG